MKAYRFKSRLTTQDEVFEEFNSQLTHKIIKAMYDIVGQNKGILSYAGWESSEDGIKKCAEIKLDLIKEWKCNGRNMAFLNNKF